jgi:colanic acid biosynthesis glycosyl transferase WcaI
MVSGPAAPPRRRVFVVSELYFPEETSTGYFLTRIAEGLSDTFDVHAIVGQPTYSARGTRAPVDETLNGVHVRRCIGTTLDKDVVAFKAINAVTLGLSMAIRLLRTLRTGDVVLVVTTPPLVPYLVAWICRLRRTRVALLVHDVYPDALVAAGLMSPGSRMRGVMDRAARWLYRSVDIVCACGRDMASLIHRKLNHATDVVITSIPNWFEPNLSPEPPEQNALLRELGLSGKFVVQYAGNMGRVHGIDVLYETAKALSRVAPDVHFVFIGFGARRAWLASAIARDGATNITLLPPRPRSEQQLFLNACHVAITAFVPGMSGVGVPSRAYNIMATGKPIVAAVDADSELALIVNEEQIGWIVPPGDVQGLVNAVLAAREDPAALREMGVRARRAVEAKYSMTHAIAAYGELVRSLG